MLVNSTLQLVKLGINPPPPHPYANILITTTTTTIQKDVPGTGKKMCRTEPSVTRHLSSRNSLAQINRLWLIDKIQGIFGWGGGIWMTSILTLWSTAWEGTLQVLVAGILLLECFQQWETIQWAGLRH